MQKTRQELTEERNSIKEDRVKLEIFKNELLTKQKVIENLRYDYLKSVNEAE